MALIAFCAIALVENVTNAHPAGGRGGTWEGGEERKEERRERNKTRQKGWTGCYKAKKQRLYKEHSRQQCYTVARIEQSTFNIQLQINIQHLKIHTRQNVSNGTSSLVSFGVMAWKL